MNCTARWAGLFIALFVNTKPRATRESPATPPAFVFCWNAGFLLGERYLKITIEPGWTITKMSFVLDLALLATGWAYVFLAPYTKVEESFNLHAIHDILMYGVRPSGLLKVRLGLLAKVLD